MFWSLGSVLDCGKCFVMWEVFWILGSKCLDSGKCLFGFWEVFCPYGPPYSLRKFEP